MIGRVCMKIAGRDAGKIGVIIDTLENGFVLIDGAVRRRKCNVMHLEFLNEEVKIKKGASHAEVVKALAKFGVVERSGKVKPKTERLKKKRKVKAVKVEKKVKVKEEKKEVKAEKKVVKKKVAKKNA